MTKTFTYKQHSPKSIISASVTRREGIKEYLPLTLMESSLPLSSLLQSLLESLLVDPANPLRLVPRGPSTTRSSRLRALLQEALELAADCAATYFSNVKRTMLVTVTLRLTSSNFLTIVLQHYWPSSLVVQTVYCGLSRPFSHSVTRKV